METRDRFLSIVKAHGFDGEVANLIADMFTYYVDVYLTEIAGQYYNSSVLKATNMDSLLQLSLDLAYPVWRGTNLIIEFTVLQADNPLFLQPLQEIYSYGGHFFYYGGEKNEFIDPSQSDNKTIKIIYSQKPKRVIEYNLNINEISVLDDTSIISEHVAFFVIYQRENVVYADYVQHTRWPSQFWSFISDANDQVLNPKDILVLTAPTMGIYAKFSDRVTRFDKTRKIRLEYLNYTPGQPPAEILAKLYTHITDNIGFRLLAYDTLEAPESHFLIKSFTAPDDRKHIIDNLTEGARFNGVIRSITDVKNFMYEILRDKIYDIRSYFYVRDTGLSSTNPVPNIYYIILIIPRPDTTITELSSIVNAQISQFWHTNYPRLRINFVQAANSPDFLASLIQQQSAGASTPTLVYPSDFLVMSPIPTALEVEYSATTIDPGALYADISLYLDQYINKIIDTIDPRDIFTYMAKNSNVSKIKFFRVSIRYEYERQTYSQVYFRYYAEDYTVHALSNDYNVINNMTNVLPIYAETIRLIRYEDFYNRLFQQNFIFQYNVPDLELRRCFLYIDRVLLQEVSGSY